MKYYQFEEVQEMSTEKAYAVLTGETYSKVEKCDDGIYRSLEYFKCKFVPKSQCILIDGKTYVKSWLVSKNDLWNYVGNPISV